MVRLFGKMGHSLYLNARGIDYREVEPNRITKSISTETTFLKDKDNLNLLTVELYHLSINTLFYCILYSAFLMQMYNLIYIVFITYNVFIYVFIIKIFIKIFIVFDEIIIFAEIFMYTYYLCIESRDNTPLNPLKEI